jgi:DNA polymerase
MIIGEAPGKDENITGKPFTGPAGQLLDKIWQSVGMDTNNWYITNVVHCRPVAEKGSGKENYTPLQTQIIKCAPYVNRQIALLDPKIIVTVGLVATQRILSREEAPSMLKVNGQVFQREVVQKSRIIFPILHPACILHSSGEQKDFYKREIWTAIQKLKGLIDDTSV